MKITAVIAGVCLFVAHGATALDWQVRKTPVDASRANPFGGNSEPVVHASTNVAGIAEFLTFKSQKTVELPLPDGTVHSFNIRPSPVLSAELSAKYPSIRSFEGESSGMHSFNNNPTRLKNERITVSLSVSSTPNGQIALHAQYVSNKRGYMFLQPQTLVGDQLSFQVSSRASAVREEPKSDFTCDTEDDTARQLMEESLVSSHMEVINNNRRKLQAAGCNVEALGNFQCDPANNREECNFDAGDCCGGFKERFAECVPEADPTGCLCKDPSYLTVTPRTLRLAVAANVEFSALYNSDEQAVMAQIVHTFTRVAGVFRREVGVGFEIVYTKIETDPATRVIGNSGTFAVAQQLPAIFDEAIGNDAYDIGHCLTTTPGGVAGGIGVSCNPSTKAMGVTGRGDVTGDVHFVDIVVHEMGHQMGSHHMFSGCGGNPGTPGFRVEPGSGTSFMSYASICGPDNIQDRMSPYFHTLSLESIRRYQSNPAGGAGCGYTSEESPVGRPNVEAQISFLNPTVRFCTIPPLTPFRLSAMSAPITEGYYYSWEQVDNTEDSETNNLDDTPPADGALFRSIPPKQNDPSRTFPDLQSIIGSTPENFHERLPPTPRGMEFVLGVRKEYVGHDVIDTTSFYLTDYSAFYVGESVKVNVSNVEPLVVTDVDVAIGGSNDGGNSTINDASVLTVSWTGGKLARKVRVVAADVTFGIENTDFSVLLASNVDNDGQVEIEFNATEICNPGSGNARFMIKVESDNYLDGCSYFAVSADPVIVDCSTVTYPPTPAPTFNVVAFEYGPEDGTFTETGGPAEEQYELDTLYTYLLTAPEGKAIHLQFLEFDVENGWDFVNVYDGDSSDAAYITQLTGVQDGASVVSSSNKLFVTLSSDNIITTRGFVAQHTAVDPNAVTTAPTSAPTAIGNTTDFEYVYLPAETQTLNYVDTIETATFIYIYASVGGVTLNLDFNSAVFEFDGQIGVHNGNSSVSSYIVESGDVPLPSYTAIGGYIIIQVTGGLPATLDFDYFVSPQGEIPPLGPVADLLVPTANGEDDLFQTSTGIVPFKLARVAADLDGAVTISLHSASDGQICFISSGNAQTDDNYSYQGKKITVVIPNTYEYNFNETNNNGTGNATETIVPDYEAYYKFYDEYVDILGNNSFEIVNVNPQTNRGNIYHYEGEAVTVNCGQNRYGESSIIVDVARSPLFTSPPFTGSGAITSNEIIRFAGTALNGVEIASSNGEDALINFKFTEELDAIVYVLDIPLVDALLGNPTFAYVFGPGLLPVGETLQVFSDKITIVLFNEGGSPLSTGPLPIEYSVEPNGGEGNGNFTEPLPGDKFGDQVNKVEIDTSNPTYFKSGNQPFGTKEHALSERWEFVAPEGYSLKITFSVLDVEESADFVHLYAGTQVGNANRVQSFTGSYVPPAIVIENNAMVLRVVRDGSDDRVYRGVQGVVEVVREDSQWYLYVIGAMGVVTVGAVALLVKKTRGGTSTAVDHDEEAMAASTVEFMEKSKRESSGGRDLEVANPLFDPNDI